MVKIATGILVIVVAFSIWVIMKPVPEKKTDAYAHVLSLMNMYDMQAVKQAEPLVTEHNKQLSMKKFMKAVDMYRNKNKAAASLTLFREAILMFPRAKAYFELGNACFSSRNFDEAEKAFNIAGFLDYNPASSLYFNHSRLSAIKGDTLSALRELEMALESGFINKEQLLKDKYLVDIRGTEKFEILMLKYFSNEAELQNALFAMYNKNFSEVDFPFEIKDEDISKFDYENTISYEFASFVKGMEDANFSRMTTAEFNYIAKVKETEKYKALAYSSISTMADTLPSVISKIVTYDSVGRFIDEMVFACHCSPSEISFGKMEENGMISVTEYKRKWKNNPYAKGFRNNEIIESEMVKVTMYMLDDDGRFQELKMEPVALTNRR